MHVKNKTTPPINFLPKILNNKPMKITSFEHNFLGFGTHPSKCIIEIRDGENQSFITFIDTDEGTSVTNASEQLANEVRGKAKHPNIRYFERYIGKPELWSLTTYDEIRYKETNGQLHSPVWESLTEETYYEIVGFER